MKSPDAYGGFTLLELLVVVAIAVILAVVAVPNLEPPVKAANAKATATQMADALTFARQYALNTSSLVTFTPNGCSYSVGTSAGVQLLAGPSSTSFGVTCQPMGSVLTFLGDGSATLCTLGAQGMTCQPPANTMAATVSGGGSIWQISVSPGGVVSTSFQ